MQAECWWPYGSTEQVVWEGVGTRLTLAAGSYTATIAGSSDAGVEYPSDEAGDSLLAFAERNIDAMLLTRNSSDIQMRLRNPPLLRAQFHQTRRAPLAPVVPFRHRFQDHEQQRLG